jgi:hypothetical protein
MQIFIRSFLFKAKRYLLVALILMSFWDMANALSVTYLQRLKRVVSNEGKSRSIYTDEISNLQYVVSTAEVKVDMPCALKR